MQRVRLGLTGLAFVFLLVVIAAAGLRPDRSMAPSDAQGETLATLGVAPGPGGDKADVPVVAPADVPPAAPARPI